MFRVSKIADYAVLIMVYMAKHLGKSHNARDIAMQTRIALPTVSKILKMLTRKSLLVSQRGPYGGYVLARSAEEITVAEILEAVDGRLAMTDCTLKEGLCALEPVCSITSNWRVISQTIYGALSALKLSNMAKPLSYDEIKIRRYS